MDDRTESHPRYKENDAAAGSVTSRWEDSILSTKQNKNENKQGREGERQKGKKNRRKE